MFLNYTDYVTVDRETVTESNEERRIFIMDESEKKRQRWKVNMIWECLSLPVLTVTYTVFVRFQEIRQAAGDVSEKCVKFYFSV